MTTYSTFEVCDEVAASYRQIHYWVQQGWIPGLRIQGRGRPLRWMPQHVEAAREIKARQDVIRFLKHSLPKSEQEAVAQEAAVSA